MSEYRIISEPYRADRFTRIAATHRRLRGDETVERLVTTVTAPDVVAALQFAIDAGDHRKRSITSVEEIIPAEALYFTDDELTAALSPMGRNPDVPDDPNLLDASEFPDDQVLYEQAGFTETVKDVAMLLGRSLVPGLHLTVIDNEDGIEEYAIVEIRDAATRDYLSTSEDLSDLIEDRTATGWNGALSIAKAIISSVSRLV